MVDWDTLVAERNEWVAYNFPTVDKPTSPIQSVQGVIEELGELSHAHLKQAQNIRGSADQHIRDGMDAVGDMMVYLMGVMNYTHTTPVDRRPFVQRASADSALLHLAVVVGALALRVDDHPKAMYFISDSTSRLVQSAKHYCDHRSWDFDGIVTETWAAVKQRDWIKYPDTGLPPVPAETYPLSQPRAVGAVGWLSAELAGRADAWNGNAPDWFPQPPEWLTLWDEAVQATKTLTPTTAQSEATDPNKHDQACLRRRPDVGKYVCTCGLTDTEVSRAWQRGTL